MSKAEIGQRSFSGHIVGTVPETDSLKGKNIIANQPPLIEIKNDGQDDNDRDSAREEQGYVKDLPPADPSKLRH